MKLLGWRGGVLRQFWSSFAIVLVLNQVAILGGIYQFLVKPAVASFSTLTMALIDAGYRQQNEHRRDEQHAQPCHGERLLALGDELDTARVDCGRIRQRVHWPASARKAPPITPRSMSVIRSDNTGRSSASVRVGSSQKSQKAGSSRPSALA